ncbi:hypothetical protein ACFLQL_01630 [Verrucomicrobiota bacterium]
MKFETTDNLNRSLVIDIEPNGEPNPDYLLVTVSHYKHENKDPMKFEGRLFPSWEFPFEETVIGAYGNDTTIGAILNLLRFITETQDGIEVEQLFTGILETGLQSGMFEFDAVTNNLRLGSGRKKTDEEKRE